MKIGKLDIREVREGWVTVAGIKQSLSNVGLGRKLSTSTLARFANGKLNKVEAGAETVRSMLSVSELATEQVFTTAPSERLLLNQSAAIACLKLLAKRERWNPKKLGLSPVESYDPQRIHTRKSSFRGDGSGLSC